MAGFPQAIPFPRKRRVVRLIFFILGGILWVAIGFALWFSYIAHRALPQLDGSLSVSGLTANVRVIRDEQGVPTIEASNLHDLFFAQGYVTAQDRLWQMDGMRRAAAGELSEVFGKQYIKFDRRQRILGLEEAARKSVQLMSPEERGRLEDYAHGVNAFIAQHDDRLPVEFRLESYAPAQWTPEASMLIAAQMVEDLSRSPDHALIREKILAKLGPQLTADLYVNSSRHDRPPTTLGTLKAPDLNAPDDDDDEEDDSKPASSVASNDPGSAAMFGIMPWPAARPRGVGSNNWVVSGEHTVLGKPLLSSDMHLHHQMPNLWYEAHLHCGNFDVVGVTLPGIPYVIVGHNQRIAWAFTNVGPTVEDAYIETFNSNGQYLTPEGWKQPQRRREVIHVKGKPDVIFDVVTTRHGPIFSELVPGEKRELALKWTLYDGFRDPFFQVDSAQNWQQFRQALSVFDAPSQNAVYADIDGNIGYQMTGKIPIRASSDGSLPENGSDDAHEWTGYIPFEKLPSTYNPPSGILATANSRVTPDGFPYSVSTEWAPPWRAERIYRVLQSGRRFSPADMLALQLDIRSEGERYFAEKFAAAVNRSSHASSRAKQAAGLLQLWDGRMAMNSAAPTIETRAREQLVRLLLEPKLGPAPQSHASEGSLNWKSYRWDMETIWLENLLRDEPARWLPRNFVSYDDLLTAAVEAAVAAPDAPDDLASWHWGTVNTINIQHPVLGHIPLLSRWTGPGVQPEPGSPYTIRAVNGEVGPSERLTVDLSNLDGSSLNLVTGEAGNFLSPYYMDQWKAWNEGYTFPLPFSERAVQLHKRHDLELLPQ
jgi:penicillin G amidase